MRVCGLLVGRLDVVPNNCTTDDQSIIGPVVQTCTYHCLHLDVPPALRTAHAVDFLNLGLSPGSDHLAPRALSALRLTSDVLLDLVGD